MIIEVDVVGSICDVIVGYYVWCYPSLLYVPNVTLPTNHFPRLLPRRFGNAIASERGYRDSIQLRFL